jgi:hypothetical protein
MAKNEFKIKNGALISGQVGIGTDSPSGSAALEISSTTQGFLPPRMPDTEMNAISQPAEGLIVWNLDNKSLWAYDGSQWSKIAYV